MRGVYLVIALLLSPPIPPTPPRITAAAVADAAGAEATSETWIQVTSMFEMLTTTDDVKKYENNAVMDAVTEISPRLTGSHQVSPLAARRAQPSDCMS